MKNTTYKLNEASLSRAYQHIVEKKSKSWGMITAFRGSNTRAENLKLNSELGKDLRELGLGFFKVEGHWRECQDNSIPYDECPKDRMIDATENTYFVPNISKKAISLLCKKYDQDAVVYGGRDTKGNAHLIFRDGSEDNVGKFHPDRIQQAYSKFKGGHSFSFSKDKKPKKDTKLSNMIPNDILDKTVKNPETGRMIKVKTALGYSKDKQVHQAAMNIVNKN